MVKSNPFAQHLNPVCKGIGVEEHIAGYALQTPCRNYDKWVDLAERRTFPSSKGDASEGEREWGREKGQGNREGRKKNSVPSLFRLLALSLRLFLLLASLPPSPLSPSSPIPYANHALFSLPFSLSFSLRDVHPSLATLVKNCDCTEGEKKVQVASEKGSEGRKRKGAKGVGRQALYASICTVFSGTPVFPATT